MDIVLYISIQIKYILFKNSNGIDTIHYGNIIAKRTLKNENDMTLIY